MQTFLVYSGNKVVGSVSAIDGDTAWMLASAVQPTATHLKPSV